MGVQPCRFVPDEGDLAGAANAVDTVDTEAGIGTDRYRARGAFLPGPVGFFFYITSTPVPLMRSALRS